MRKIRFNEDVVPTNLNEAVKILMESLTSEDKVIMREPNSCASHHHFTTGMKIRNEWSLWERESRLVKWFGESYSIEHADDISSMILECLWNDVRGEPRRDRELALRFIKHWAELNNCSTDETKYFGIDKNGNITTTENNYEK